MLLQGIRLPPVLGQPGHVALQQPTNMPQIPPHFLQPGPQNSSQAQKQQTQSTQLPIFKEPFVLPKEPPSSSSSSSSSSANNNLFECPVCQQQVRGASSLRYHKLRHEGRFPYVCPYCAHGTPNTINMKKHLRAKHTGRLGYDCNRCWTQFVSLADLKQHLDSNVCQVVTATAAAVGSVVGVSLEEDLTNVQDTGDA